jgi:hypothetical protein
MDSVPYQCIDCESSKRVHEVDGELEDEDSNEKRRHFEQS